MIDVVTWHKTVFKVTSKSVEKAVPDPEYKRPRTKRYVANSDAVLVVISESKKIIQLYIGRLVVPKDVQKNIVGIALAHEGKKLVINKIEALAKLRSWDILVLNYNKTLELEE
ncbi:MAG: hypothetical protein ACW98F_00180 [Candidatus Hodarchaeales archaeon]|jgi:hypothetical protein